MLRTRDGPEMDQGWTTDGPGTDLGDVLPGDVRLALGLSSSHLACFFPFLLSASICEAVSLSS